MIDSLKGILSRKDPMSVTIDVAGVGYRVFISLQTYERLAAVGQEVHLLTHLHVREDALQLYGFTEEEERRMFRELQGISGIGSRIAMNILSKCNVRELHSYVAAGNVGALVSIPGIGKKTAERIVVELRDRLAKTSPMEASRLGDGTQGDSASEALMALLALGYSRQSSEKALLRSIQQTPEPDRSTAVLLKNALRLLHT